MNISRLFGAERPDPSQIRKTLVDFQIQLIKKSEPDKSWYGEFLGVQFEILPATSDEGEPEDGWLGYSIELVDCTDTFPTLEEATDATCELIYWMVKDLIKDRVIDPNGPVSF